MNGLQCGKKVSLYLVLLNNKYCRASHEELQLKELKSLGMARLMDWAAEPRASAESFARLPVAGFLAYDSSPVRIGSLDSQDARVRPKTTDFQPLLLIPRLNGSLLEPDKFLLEEAVPAAEEPEPEACHLLHRSLNLTAVAPPSATARTALIPLEFAASLILWRSGEELRPALPLDIRLPVTRAVCPYDRFVKLPLAADHLPGMMRHDLKDLASTGLPVINYHCLALDHELPHNGK